MSGQQGALTSILWIFLSRPYWRHIRVSSYSSYFSQVPKIKLQKKWEAIPQEHIRATCNAFVDRLKAVVRNKGSYIE